MLFTFVISTPYNILVTMLHSFEGYSDRTFIQQPLNSNDLM